jgi:carbonic anhydrase/acetyltransferase-like protein (isoleucine patch superfamily)
MISEWNGHKPDIHTSAYIHESAQIIGKVKIGKDVSVWPNVVIRGDIEEIVIGEGTNIQDNTVMHTDFGSPTVLGNRISVGHSVVLHGCTIEDDCLIGMRAIILDNTILGKECLVGAGALVTSGKTIPQQSMVYGSPARVVRELEEQEIEQMKKNAAMYIQLKDSY